MSNSASLGRITALSKANDGNFTAKSNQKRGKADVTIHGGGGFKVAVLSVL